MMYKELCGETISRLGMGNMRLPTNRWPQRPH